jgi:type I restriction enzyme S subunit
MARQEPQNSPETWATTSLPDVVFFQEGPGLRKFQYRDSGIPFVNIRTIKNERVDNSLCKFLDESEVNEKYKHFLLEEGDIICSTSGTIGKTAIIEQINLPLMLNTSIIRFRSNNKLLVISSFIYYFLKSNEFLNQVDRFSTGSAQKNIGPSHLKQFNFSFPPLPEQKRIVEKLDSLLAQVDTIQRRLNDIPNIIKRFRQSILAAAVSGKLTEQWRRENQCLVKLEVISDKYVIPDDFPVFPVPNEWLFVPIGNVATFQQGMQIAKSSRFTEDGDNRLPILKIGNYSSNFTKDVEFTTLSEQSLIAEKEDIILTRTGESRGRVLTGFKGVFHNNTFRINYDTSFIHKEYLVYALKNSCTLNYIREVSGRSAQPDLTHSKFGPCPISIPSFKEQTEIVRLVEQHFALAETLEKHLAIAKQRVDNLTQSILAKTFKGELVPQDPFDEPAEQLLERIKTAREEAEKLEKAAKKVKSKSAKS